MTATVYFVSFGSLIDPHVILVHILLGLATIINSIAFTMAAFLRNLFHKMAC